jgi:RIO-like serine/threonine protein kinase
MFDEVLRVFKELDSKDFRILTGIETGMRHFEWVPVEELNKYTNMKSKLFLAGVCVLGFTAENILGINPSLLMLKNTLD